VKTRLIGGKIEWDSSFSLDPLMAELPKLTETPKVSVIIPVRNIESGNQRMNEVMHGALSAQKHKYARYSLKEMKLAETKRKTGDPLVFDTKGTLSVNGKTAPVSMQISITKAEGDKLEVSGKTKLKMSQFGVVPPAPKIALGLITTGDEVSVEFNWFVAPKK
jgi:polyisoprenoid-binding protein YceI